MKYIYEFSTVLISFYLYFYAEKTFINWILLCCAVMVYAWMNVPDEKEIK